MSCSCHIDPPCSWCTSLTEEEVAILDQGGTNDDIIKLRELHELVENDCEIIMEINMPEISVEVKQELGPGEKMMGLFHIFEQVLDGIENASPEDIGKFMMVVTRKVATLPPDQKATIQVALRQMIGL